jgi:predicted DCC family thiol-disulfide oxidoreductase YuxK
MLTHGSHLVVLARFRFVSLQSKVGKSLLIRSGRNPDDISSIVLCTKDGQAFVESDAILEIAQGLDGPLPIFGVLGKVVPPIIRDAAYHIVSENRYRFGEYDSCRMDFDGDFESRFVPDPDL